MQSQVNTWTYYGPAEVRQPYHIPQGEGIPTTIPQNLRTQIEKLEETEKIMQGDNREW